MQITLRGQYIKKIFYVYVLRDEQRQHFYIGYSSDLRRRIREHKGRSVRTTKSANYELVYYEAYLNKADAVGREKFLKGGSGHRYLAKQLSHYLSEAS